MRKLWGLLKKHCQEDFHPTYYASVALFLFCSLAFNYYIGLENKIIDRHPDEPARVIWYFLLYAFAYYGGSLLMIHFKKRNDLLYSKQFWWLTGIGILLLALNSGFPYMTVILRQLEIDIHLFLWIYAIGNNAIGFLLIALPLFVLHFFTLPKTKLYGLTQRFDAWPYFALLLVILPIIVTVSFDSNFQNYYPTYKSNWVAESVPWPVWLPMITYEFVYGLDFFNTEFLFRGFMVIGLAHILGKDAIIPMVVTYCFLHFGKPVGEAISSIFGGYILGIIAFYTRSIWGGVMVHAGLAWMMELAAYLQKVF